jgi:hypothetical protein
MEEGVMLNDFIPDSSLITLSCRKGEDEGMVKRCCGRPERK